jgi:hypothetical protein
MGIKGTIVFTETGFILTPKNGEVEVYQKNEVVGGQYTVLNGIKYKWVNQPKKVETSIEKIEEEEEDSDEEE